MNIITIAADTLCLIVCLQLKYVAMVYDTGTALTMDDKSIYVTHRNTPTSRYNLETQILSVKRGR